MSRRSLILMLLMTALAGCNLPAVPGGGVTSPTERMQIVTPSTGELAADTPTAEQIQIASPSPVELAADTPTPPEVVPIKGVPVQIEGAAYTAYRMPGDPFRFVCQDPCPLDPQYIYAEYAGFRAAHVMMVAMLGIDTLVELQPVDMHLVLQDSICGSNPYGHAYIYNMVHQAYTCTDGPGYYPSMKEKIQKAALASEQYFPIHEYMHTLFFGRISGKVGSFYDYKAEFFHDYVVPVPSYVVGFLPPASFCAQDTGLAPGDFGGGLITELCRQNGFNLDKLKLSLVELDNLYQSGGGQVIMDGYQHPAPTVAQYRDILNSLLGSDTTGAFAAACWPPELFGNSYSPLPACIVPVESGTATPVK
jgi:hypothetical protein